MPGALEQVPVALGLFLSFFVLGKFSQSIAQMIFYSKLVQTPGKIFPSNHQEVIWSLYSSWGFVLFSLKTSEMHLWR